MALSGAIVTSADGTAVFFGTPTASSTSGSGYTFDVTRAPYGAVGDGVTNDTAAIQAAIDAAELAGGGTVYFPEGMQFGVTTLLIDSPDVELLGYGASLEQLAGSGFNQTIWIKGEIDSGTAERIKVKGLTINGNYPTVTPSGAGIGINIRAWHVEIIDVTVNDTKGESFVGAYCLHYRLLRCKSVRAGASGYSIRGDHPEVLDCEAHDWNTSNTTGNRAIRYDTQECDAEECIVKGFRGYLTEVRDVADSLLFDPGDGGVAGGSNDIPCGNGGAATNSGGYAAWTIDAGHGFKAGHGFRINESGVSSYDGGPELGKQHVITSVTGEVYVYVVDANTLKLYTNAQDARTQAGGVQGRYDLQSAGVGTFYIKSRGGRIKQFSVLSQADDTITCTSHNFATGNPARLTCDDYDDDELPAGLKGVAVIKTKTRYVSAGADAVYRQPKRVKNLTLRDIRMECEPSAVTTSAALKINNACNAVVDRLVVAQTPDRYVDTGDAGYQDEEFVEFYSLIFGGSSGKVRVKDSVLPGGIAISNRSWIADLEIDHNEIGAEGHPPSTAINNISAGKLHIHDNLLRFSFSAYETPDAVDELSDFNISDWHIHDNIEEANSSSRARVILIGDSTHLVRSRLVRYYNNERRNVGTYTGLAFTAAADDTITATAHCLETGDAVSVTTTGTFPTASPAFSDEEVYWVRRTGQNTLTLHTTLHGASDGSDLVAIDATPGGSGEHRLVSPKVGVALTNFNPRDFAWLQRGSTGRDFWGTAAPTNSAFLWHAQDTIWNINPASGSPMGWICTKTGYLGTPSDVLATFEALEVVAPT